MATTWKAPTWRMPNEKNQSKFENYSLDFDGTEFIDLGTDTTLELTSDFSVSVWIKESGSLNRGIICCGDRNNGSGWHIYRTSTNKVAFNLYTANSRTATSTTSVNTGNWINVIATFEKNGTANQQIKIYVNNTLEDDNGWISAQTPSYSGTIYKQIAYPYAGANEFLGNISTPVVFDYLLSSDQRSYLYNSGLPINPMTLKPAPIAYYPLGGNASTGGDSTNTLSVPNVAVPDASVFDFVPNDYINCGQNVVENSSNWTALTVSAWVKKDATGTYGRVIGKDDGGSNRVFLLQVQNNETLSGSIRTIGGGAWDNVVTAATIALGEWQHVAMTYLGNGTIKLYINGQQEATDTNTIANLNPVTTDTLIGAKGNISNMFEGEISNVQIWQAELSSTEITTLYNSGVPLLTGTQPQETNLKAWYKLDQSANWEADAASTWQIPDAVSSYPQSFSFDGSDDYIDIGNFKPSTTSLSISAWAYKPDTTNGSIIGRGASVDYGIFVYSGSLQFGLNDGSWTTISTTLPTNQWFHVCATWDGTTIKLYVNNGTPVTASATGTITYTSNDTTIGKNSTLSGFEWNGKISNVQIWNTGLDSSQVETLYNNGTPLTTAIATDNLKAWYKLDNTATFSTNWSVPDASGNGNTGTSSGMTEQNLVNNNVSALNGESSGMDTSNLVTSTLTRQVPYNSYSLNFDSGSSDYIDCGDADVFSFGDSIDDSPFSISAWINFDDVSTSVGIISKYGNSSSTREWLFYIAAQNFRFLLQDGSYNNYATATSTTISANQWYHVVCTYNGVGGANANQGMNIYVNGQLQTLSYAGSSSYVAMHNTSQPVEIARYGGSAYTDCKESNVAIFNKELTSTEVVKLYNSGVPGDLSSFNPTPVSWWSLGSDSYFNGSSWICPDLISTNNGTSTNMDDDALIGDAPNSTANGTSTNMAIDANLTGNAPNSSNNSFSVNMDYTDRETSVPS